MTIKFGNVTAGEIDVMLEASSESEPLAQSILNKRVSTTEYELTYDEATYLRDNLWGDADRVAEAIGAAAGRAFYSAGNRLDNLLQSELGQELQARAEEQNAQVADMDTTVEPAESGDGANGAENR